MKTHFFKQISSGVVRSGRVSLLALLALLCTSSFALADVVYSDTDPDNPIPTTDIVTGSDGVGNVTFDIAESGTYNKTISGGGSVSKTGTGSLTIIAGDAGETYTGGTTVSAGTLYLQGNNKGKSSVGTGDLTISSGAKVEAKSSNVFGHTSASNMPHIIINGGVLQPLAYLHMNTVELNGGTIAKNNGGTGLDFNNRNGVITSTGTSSIAAAITHTSTLTFDVQSGVLSLTGTVSNNGTDTIKKGAGTLTTSNWMNKYVTIQDGTLRITGQYNDKSKRFNGTVDICKGATLECATKDSLGFGTAVTTLNIYGTMDITSSNSNETLKYTTLHLYGGTVKSTGNSTLDVCHNNVKFYSYALDGATETAPTVSTVSAVVNLRTSGTFEINTAANSQINLTNAMQTGSGGSCSVTKLGEGTLLLSARNTFTGGMIISKGKVIANAVNASASTFGTGAISIASGATLEFQVSNQLGTSSPNDIVIKGTLIPSNFTHVKNITLENGVIDREYGYTASGSGLDFNNRTATIKSTGNSSIKSRLALRSGSKVTVNVPSDTDNLTIDGVIFDSAGFTKTGDGTLTLTAANTFSGGITIDGGTLKVTSGAPGTGRIVNNQGVVEFAAEEDETIAIACNISNYNNTRTIKTGAGTLTTSRWISGNVEIQEGTLKVTGKYTDSDRRFSGSVTIAQGAKLECATKDTLGYQSGGSTKFYIYGLMDSTVENETLTNTEFHMYGGTLQASSGSTYDIFNNGVKFYSYALDGATEENPTVSTVSAILLLRTNGTLPIDTAANSQLDLTGVIQTGSGNCSITKLGDGTLAITAANTYTSNTIISEGTLKLSGNGTLGTGSVENSANLEFAHEADKTFANVISGSGTVSKTGDETLTLTGANTYTGETTVSAGVLELTGAAVAANGPTTVEDNGTLIYNLTEGTKKLTVSPANKIFSTGQIKKTGDGVLQINAAQGAVDAQSLVVSSGRLDMKTYFKGALTVGEQLDAENYSIATFSPGNSVGTLNIDGDFVLNSGSTLLLEQDGSGMDKLVASSFAFADDSIIELSIGAIAPGATYDVIVQSDGVFPDAQQNASYWTNLIDGGLPYYMDLSVIGGNTVRLHIDANAVPEPSTWALLVLGVIVLYLRKRVRS